MKPIKLNIKIGCTYRHPSIDSNVFNNIYLKKTTLYFYLVILMSIYSNIRNTVSQMNVLIHFHHNVLPYILHPTRIHGQSRTLISNIFSNQYNKEAISCKLISITCDYFPQFLFVPTIFSNPPSFKSNIFERNWSKFNEKVL